MLRPTVQSLTHFAAITANCQWAWARITCLQGATKRRPAGPRTTLPKPAPPDRPSRRGSQSGLGGLEQFLPGILELVDTLVLQGEEDVGEVDADRVESV